MDRDTGEDAFREWLGETTTLTPRTIGDVLSRLRRVERTIDLSGVSSDADLTIRLLGSEEFRACSPAVKSQLKRAARHFIEFSGRKQGGDDDVR